MGDTRKSVRALFDEAAEVESAAARRAFLDRECDGYAALRAEVEALLRAHETAGGFLANPSRETNGDVATVSLKEGDRVGRYQLLEKIGEGGCGVVYLAEQTEPVRRRVALKVIKLGMDTRSVITRFEAERQALALMDHPNIARVLDAGTTAAGRPFFVMELVRGIKITDYCAQHRLSISARLRLFIQVCQAVQHAHQKGIIHRDLKPSNVLVTSSDGTPVPKVIDFGVAKATAGVQLTDEALLTRVGLLVGTPAYMSPEQAEFGSGDVDTRTDIYSLGVLLYELLTGRPPFDTDTWLKSGIDALRKAIRETPPKRPSTRLALELAESRAHQPPQRNSQEIQRTIQSVRGDLDWIVLKALEKDRARRYETANAFAMDIQRHLDNEPVVARPPSPAYLLQKSFRRHRPAFLAAAAIALLLVAGVVFATRDAVRTHRSEKIQRELREKAETNQKQADAANRILKRNLFIREWLDAEIVLDEGKTVSALAWFARAARDHPDDVVVQTRLLSLLTEGCFLVPAGRPFVHDSPIHNFTFLSDGQHLATAAGDGKVRVWPLNAQSSPLILSNQFERPAVAVAPGKSMFLVDDARSVSLWNLNALDRLVPLAHPVNLRLPISVDGRFAAVHETESSCRVWNIAELTPMSASLKGMRNPFGISPDGKYVFGSDMDSQLAAWEISTGRLVWQTPRTPAFPGQGMVEAVVHPEGRRVIVSCWLGSEGGELSGWTFEPSSAGGPAVATSEGWTLYTRSVIGTCCFSPDGRELYVGDGEGHLGIVNLATHELHSLNGEHDGRMTWMCLASDGHRLATGSVDGTVRLWDTRIKFPEPLVITNAVSIRVARFSPDSQWFACNGEGAVEIRETRSGSLLKRLPLNGVVTRVDVSRDGRRILACYKDGRISVWDTDNSTPVFPPIEMKSPRYAEFSPDANSFLVTLEKDTVEVHETETGRKIGPTITNSTTLTGLTFGPDSQTLALVRDPATVDLWSLPDARRREKVAQHKDLIWSETFSPDGKSLLTASRDRTAALWNVESGGLIREFRHEQQVYVALFNPEGTRIVTGDASRKAHIWDVRTGKRLFALPTHGGGVWFCDFSADGQVLLTGDDAGNARVWEAASGLPLGGWLHTNVKLRNIRLSPDGRTVLAVLDNGTIRLWPVVRAQLPAPNWLPDLAESLAGRRLRDDGNPELVPAEQWETLRTSLSSQKADDFNARWANWFFVERFKERPALFVP